MAEPNLTKEQQLQHDAWLARRLLRGAKSAVLSTQTAGQPFAALVTPAVAPDGAILLLLSRLSEHTRHLLADPRCALLVAGQAETANPQTAPRVAVTGTAAVVARDQPDHGGLLACFLTWHPYAQLYAGFADFELWRITPGAGMFVGGFARATRLRGADLRSDPLLPRRVAGETLPWLDRLTARKGIGTGWHLAGVDGEGVVLGRGEGETAESCRLDFSAPLAAGDEPGLTLPQRLAVE